MSLWLHSETADPGVDLATGSSYSHTNPSLSTALPGHVSKPSRPTQLLTSRGLNKGLPGVGALATREASPAPTAGTYGPSELVSPAPFIMNAEKRLFQGMSRLAPRQMAKLSWMNHAEEFLSADHNGAPNTETERGGCPGDASTSTSHPRGPPGGELGSRALCSQKMLPRWQILSSRPQGQVLGLV